MKSAASKTPLERWSNDNLLGSGIYTRDVVLDDADDLPAGAPVVAVFADPFTCDADRLADDEPGEHRERDRCGKSGQQPDAAQVHARCAEGEDGDCNQGTDRMHAGICSIGWTSILAGIRELESRSSRMRLGRAEELVAGLLAALEGTQGLVSIVPAGSFRRRRETIGDLDLLAETDDPAALAAVSAPWAPWRSYVTHHLWASLGPSSPPASETRR